MLCYKGCTRSRGMLERACGTRTRGISDLFARWVIRKPGSANFENVRCRFAVLHFRIRSTGHHVVEQREAILQVGRLNAITLLRTARGHGHGYIVSSEVFQEVRDACINGIQVHKIVYPAGVCIML